MSNIKFLMGLVYYKCWLSVTISGGLLAIDRKGGISQLTSKTQSRLIPNVNYFFVVFGDNGYFSDCIT